MVSQPLRRPFGRARFLALTATIVAIASAAPSVAPAANVVDRDVYSTTVDAGNDKLKTTISSQPINYEDGSGAWRAIDTDLEETAGGDLQPKAIDGELRIPDSLTQPIELEHDGKTVSLRLIGANAGTSASADGSEASFDGALSGVDASYVARPNGVKETLTLASVFAPRVFSYDLRAYASWSAALESGDVVVRDSVGTERYRVSAPLAWDSAADPALTNALALSVFKVADGRWHVTLRPDDAWLADPARVYPVMVDPDFYWVGSDTTRFHGADADCQVAGGSQANTKSCAWPTMYTGYSSRPYRALFKFNVGAAIPSNATVSAATFTAYAPGSYTLPNAAFRLHTITSDWDNNATWNNRKTGTPWGTAGGDFSAASNLTSSPTTVNNSGYWYYWQAPVAAVQGWVDGSVPNYGFLLKTDATTGPYGWVSTDDDQSEWPALDVTWTAAPSDSTAPEPPSHVEQGYLTTGAVSVSFQHGIDTTPSSGIDGTEVRRQINGGAWSSWSLVSGTSFNVPSLTAGDRVALELRTVDTAGNRSTTIVRGFEVAAAPTPGVDAGAVEFAMNEWGYSSTVARAWIEAQADAGELDSVISDDLNASSDYAGYWFDNENRRVKINVLSANGQAAIAPLVASAGLSSSVDFIQVSHSPYYLETKQASVENHLAQDIDDGWVIVSYTIADTPGIRIRVAAGAGAATRTRVADEAAALNVPHTVIEDSTQQFEYTPQRCDSHAELDDGTPPAPDIRPGCDPPVRGGIGIDGVQPCTAGFNVRSKTDDKPYVLTAGHCIQDPQDSTWLPGLLWSTNGLRPFYDIGTTHRYEDSSCFLMTCLRRKPDAAIIKINSDLEDEGVPPVIFTPESWTGSVEHNPSLPIKSVGKAAPGEVLCMTGARAGSRCGRVKRDDWKEAGGHHINLEKVCGGLKGDSGGPVWAKRRDGTAVAKGIILAGSTNGSCERTIQDMTKALSKLNVELVTLATQWSWDVGYCPPYDTTCIIA